MEKIDIEKIFTAFAINVISQAKNNLQKGKKDVTNELANSLSYILKVNDKKLLLSFVGAYYAKFQDQGVSGVKRKYNTPFSYKSKGGKQGLKGMPPSSAFDKWGIIKGIAPRTKTGQFQKRKTLNFLIARSVFLKGVAPSLFFTSAFDKYFKDIPEELQKYLIEDITENI